MKHQIICHECHASNPKGNSVWAIGEVQSELFAICYCSNGHTLIEDFSHDLFDILYTSAINALLDSYYSESIMSFTASLERAYELYIKLFLSHSGLSLQLIDEFWKELSNQSERQYGTFCSVYITVEKYCWKSEQNQIKFRNKVIHKGHIATRAEAETYAKYVTSQLNLIMKSTRKNFTEQKSSLYFHMKKENNSSLQKIMKENDDAKIVTSARKSLLHWGGKIHVEATLDDSITIAKQLRTLFDV